MSEPVYKRAGIEDINTIIELTLAFAHEYAGPQDEALIARLRARLQEYYTTALPNNEVLCWYATVDGAPAGLGAINVRQQYPNLKNLSGKVGYVFNMFTHQHHRRKGIAATILSKLKTTAQEIEISVFELHATKDGAPVYEQNGFRIHPEPTYRMYI